MFFIYFTKFNQKHEKYKHIEKKLDFLEVFVGSEPPESTKKSHLEAMLGLCWGILEPFFGYVAHLGAMLGYVGHLGAS